MADKPSSVLVRKFVSEDDKKAAAKQWANSDLLRERAMELIRTSYQQARSKQISEMAYGSAAWPMLQADYNGYLRALEQVAREIFNEEI